MIVGTKAGRTRRFQVRGRNVADADVAAVRTSALIYVGSDDHPACAERAAKLMPNATFVLHSAAFSRADLLLPSALAFLSSAVASGDR